MNWTKFSIKNKYTIFALIISVIFLGIYAKNTLNVQLMPDTAPPSVSVMTNYPGASAQDVGENVTEILEEEISLVDGVKKVKSTSQSDLSLIKVEFYYAINVDEAAMDIENAVARVASKLPVMAQKPQVVKFSTSDKPILTLALESDKMTLTEIRALADNELKNKFQQIESVAAVDVFGGHEKQINVYLNKNDIVAYNITSQMVSNALAQYNVAASAGRVTEITGESLIRIDEKFATLHDLDHLILSELNGQTIFLKDIATIEESESEQRSLFKVNGEEAISMQIIKKSDANTVETAEAVLEQISSLETKYPGIRLTVANNDAVFTNQVMNNMTSSMMAAVFMTFLILMLFISSMNESIIVALSMPLSFLSSLGLMKVFALPLDMITLSALILSMGFVVDNSIVVVENIMRHHNDLHKDMKSAAIEGTQEIMLSILAGTGTTLIVLIPLLFIESFIGKVFGPLAKTMIFTLTASYVVAVTVVPLLLILWQKGTLLKRADYYLSKYMATPFHRALNVVKGFYLAVLKASLARKKTVLSGSLILLLVSVILFVNIGLEVFPRIDSGTFTISVEADPSYNLQQTNAILIDIETLLKNEPEVVISSVQAGYEPGGHFLGETGALGVNQGYFTVTLTSRKDRAETIWQIEERLRNKINQIPGIRSLVIKESGSTAVASTVAPIDLRISGSNQEVLDYIASDLEGRIKLIPGTINIYRSWHSSNPEVRLHLNDRRLAELGLTPQIVANQLFMDLQGKEVGNLDLGENRQAAIVVRYEAEGRNSLSDLLEATVISPKGIKVPLRELGEISVEERPNLVTRENMEYTLDIFGFTQDRAFSHVIREIQTLVDETPLPEGYAVTIAGEQTDLMDSVGNLRFSLVLAVIFVYLLLLSQFKSFVHPLTIMAAIPLMLIGVALALLLTGKYVSMPVLLAFILLAGTVVNNAILLVDFIVTQRKSGRSGDEAILDAVRLRFRPIMMTALSDIAGMMPLALEFALGSEKLSPLSISIIGGISASTFLTLIIIPVLFSSIEEAGEKIRKKIRTARNGSEDSIPVPILPPPVI